MVKSAALKDRRILVVEDEYLVAMMIMDILEEAGAKVLGPAGRIDEAMGFVENEDLKIDGALLDVNLNGEKSYPVADALAARDVRFVFASGYGADALDNAYRMHPRCEKPIDAAALVRVLSAVLVAGAE